MVDINEVEDQCIIASQQYKIWKKNVPFLYEISNSYEILTCTQTVQWLDHTVQGQLVEHHYCIIGTNSIGTNKLYLMRIDLPVKDTLGDKTQFKYEAGVGQFGLKRVVVQKQIERHSQINKARKKPEGKYVAVKSGGNPHVSLLNLDYKSNFQDGGMTLEGHTAEGMGLDWNPINTNFLASGSSDRRICVWDIEANQTQTGSIKPLTEYVFHSMGVQDISWNYFNPQIFASCGQDRLIAIWDIRQNKKKPEIQKSAHNSDVYAVKFSPFAQTLIISAGEDSEIALWDTRFFSKRLHTFAGHTNAVNCLKWSPTNRTRFISGGSDNNVMMWDLLDAGNENQIVFIHSGHQSRVLDIDINKNNENLVLSSEEYNLIQVWKPNEMAISRSDKDQIKETQHGEEVQMEQVKEEAPVKSMEVEINPVQ